MARRVAQTGERSAQAARLARPTPTSAAWLVTLRALAPRRAVALLLLGAALYRIALLARGWPSLDSDEAIIGLMARHIWLLGEHPIFFYGQYYLGPTQAYLAAALFAVFGSSLLTLRLVGLGLTLGVIALVYPLAHAAYGRAVALLTLAWLAFGPPYAVLRELVTVGGHQEMLICAALLLLLVWRRLRRSDARPTTPRQRWLGVGAYAAMGLLAGFGYWSDLLILPFILGGAVALLIGRRREVVGVYGLILLLFFCEGAAPFILFNITYKNASYKEIVRQSRPPGRENSWPTLPEWRDQFGETLAVALPAALGSPHVCVTQGDIWVWYPPQMAAKTRSVTPCNAANILYSLAALALYVCAAWPIAIALLAWARGPQVAAARDGALRWLRRRGLLRAGPATPPTHNAGGATTAAAAASPPDTQRRAQLWLRAIMLGVPVFTIFAYSSSIDAQRYEFTAARYFLPLYLTTPLLFGALWGLAQPALAALWRSRSRPRVSRRLLVSLAAGLALVAIFAQNLVGAAQTYAYAGDTQRFGLPAPSADQRLIAFLDTRHIRAFYTDYWTCYRLAFEMNERAICAVRGQNGEPSLAIMNNRYDPYVTVLASAPHPAFLLPAGTRQDALFTAEMAAQGLDSAGYQRVVVGAYAIYYYQP